ncbi:MAG: methyltransferase domain-containing protein [Deltaproteobacteria bacterium]|nr:methyltransferase domain-containing protein [Deltaproteobacteria bacterium]
MDLRETGDGPRHPWELARARFLIGQLRAHKVTATAHRVLDGGAGDAWFARQLLGALGPQARVTCWDAEYDAETAQRIEAAGDGRIACATALPAGPFDLVTLLDVAEHVEDDHTFVRRIVVDALRPAGWLLLTVPAWQGLYTSHDVFLRHHRRYSMDQGRALLTGAGLELVASGGLFHSLLAPRALQKLKESVTEVDPARHKPGITWSAGPRVTAAVRRALAVDNALSAAASAVGVSLPGLSFWALARKP